MVRFDSGDLSTLRDQALVEIANRSLQVYNHVMTSDSARTQISHESVRVSGETEIAQTFADFDPRYFSRIEIIDAIGDLNFLGVEASFYDWQANTHDQRTQAETAKIDAERNSATAQLELRESGLAASELRSPADGRVFVRCYAMGSKSTSWAKHLSWWRDRLVANRRAGRSADLHSESRRDRH